MLFFSLSIIIHDFNYPTLPNVIIPCILYTVSDVGQMGAYMQIQTMSHYLGSYGTKQI
jgi:hypothetical protein